MTPPLRAVLDLGQLLREPERVGQLSTEEARALVTQVAALLVLLSSRASESQITKDQENKDPAQWLSAEQVESRFGLPNSWLMEHRRQLASLGIVSRPSRKLRLYDSKKLGRFIESRRQSTTTNEHVALSRRGHAS